METARRTFFRDTEENRREALILATQALVAEGGPQAATVRAIAARAGVTPGLIRHYFGSKDELTRASYSALMGSMTDKGADALAGVGADPAERLAAYIAASLRPPVLDARAVGLWAGFLHQVRADPGLLVQHEENYLHYRDLLQSLIAELPRDGVTPAQLRSEAIACNGLIDGLWLEGSILTDSFAEGEIVRLALVMVGRLLGVDLTAHATFIPELHTPNLHPRKP